MSLLRPRPPRDTDSTVTTRAIGILALGGVACLVMGGALGLFLLGGLPGAALGVVVFGVPMAFLMWLITRSIVEASGVVAGGLFHPTAERFAMRRDLSREESLIAAGRHEEAIEALMAAAAADPGDPRPAWRLAELHRDELGSPEEAVTWLGRAAAVPGLAAEEERQILRAMLEVAEGRLGNPRLAAPALARAAETRAGTRVGIWARQELRRIRSAAQETGSPVLRPRSAAPEAGSPASRPGSSPDP